MQSLSTYLLINPGLEDRGQRLKDSDISVLCPVLCHPVAVILELGHVQAAAELDAIRFLSDLEKTRKVSCASTGKNVLQNLKYQMLSFFFKSNFLF